MYVVADGRGVESRGGVARMRSDACLGEHPYGSIAPKLTYGSSHLFALGRAGGALLLGKELEYAADEKVEPVHVERERYWSGGDAPGGQGSVASIVGRASRVRRVSRMSRVSRVIRVSRASRVSRVSRMSRVSRVIRVS